MDEDSTVRVIDVFVDGLDLKKLGFEHAGMAKLAKAAAGEEALIALANRGYNEGYEILECERAGVAAVVPQPMTSNNLLKLHT